MKKILIIGFGNIGKRHFESIYKSKYSIKLIDTQINQFDFLIKKKITLTKNITFQKNFSNLSDFYDLVIIATSSENREKIIEKLLLKTNFKNIILEKIVFQRMESYNYYIKKFKRLKINCWINCPNRSFKVYNKLKKNLNAKKPIVMIVSGNNWGLACNFVHFTDLFYYLINYNDFKNIDINLEKKIIKSKRPGYIEFNGTIKIVSKNNDILIIHHGNEMEELNLKIIQNGLFFDNDYSKPTAHLRKNKINSKIDFVIPLMSQTTSIILKDIFSKNSCNLPSLKDHYKINKEILNKMYLFTKNNYSSNIKRLPIT